MTADIFQFPDLGAREWPKVRQEIAEFLQQCGGDERMVSTVCERMRGHYVNCGLAEPFSVPPIHGECTEAIASIEATITYFKRVNAALFAKLVTLEVYLYQQQSPAVAPAGQPRQES